MLPNLPYSERCIIKANGKEDFSLLTVFSGEGEFDFTTGIHFGMAS